VAWHADVTALAPELASLAAGNPALASAFERALAPLRRPAPPQFVWITPSAPLGYPLRRFPKGKMRNARRLGRDDAARTAL
jgi:hypothetical protein